MFSDSLEMLDNIRLNFNQSGLFLLNITLSFVMFGIAALWGIWHIISELGIATIMSKKPIRNN
ncbi:MAG: hypothetical protein KAQ75_17295 [Bacteroidales bacterium]|nr:hypothetical protein [Bacteroidales bacterium]